MSIRPGCHPRCQRAVTGEDGHASTQCLCSYDADGTCRCYLTCLRLAVTELTDYAKLLADIKSRIQAAQTRAVLAVNAELIRLYWGGASGA